MKLAFLGFMKDIPVFLGVFVVKLGLLCLKFCAKVSILKVVIRNIYTSINRLTENYGKAKQGFQTVRNRKKTETSKNTFW